MAGKCETDALIKQPKKRWLIVLVVWLAGVVHPLNMVKITVLAPALMESFAINEDFMGVVMSMFYVLSLVLAFPAASIIDRIGLRRTTVIALILAIVGGVLGALSNDVATFMVSRVVEGCGMGVMGVVGVAAITPWFAPSKRGLPLAIWGMWVTVSFLIGPIAFPSIYEASGSWQLVWWILVGFAVLVLLLFSVFYRDANFTYDESENVVPLKREKRKERHSSTLLTLKTPIAWVLGIMMFCYAAASMALENFFPTYVYGLDFSLTTAGWIVSSGAIIGSICALIAGKLSDTIHSRKKVMLVGFIAAVIYAAILFRITALWAFIPVMIILGIGENWTASQIYGSTSQLMPPEKINGASALLAFLQNLGMLFGTTVIGFVFTSLGNWSLAALLVPVPLYAVGLVLTVAFWKKLP